MKTISILSVSLLAALAAATPTPLIPKHQHHKRAVVYVTVTSEVVETVNVVKTIWVPAGGAKAVVPVTTTSSASAAPAPAAPSPVVAPAPVVLPQEAPKVVVTPSPSPSPAPVVVAPPPPPPPPPVVVKPSPSPSPSPAAPSATPSVPANTGTTYPPTVLPGAKVSDECTPGKPCSGDMTFFNPSVGMGACGTRKADGSIYLDSDLVVAVAVNMMGSLSSGDVINPLCFRNIEIELNGKTAIGQVVDKCAGCAGDADIDLSPALFDKLGVEGTGRYHDVKWHWV